MRVYGLFLMIVWLFTLAELVIAYLAMECSPIFWVALVVLVGVQLYKLSNLSCPKCNTSVTFSGSGFLPVSGIPHRYCNHCGWDLNKPYVESLHGNIKIVRRPR